LTARRFAAVVAAVPGAVAVAALASACGGSPAAPLTPPPGAAQLYAANLAFQPLSMSAPAGQPFVLFFDNREASPHNVRLVDAAGQALVATDVFTGPGAQIADVPALAAGTYRLLCDVHPDMHAELIAGS
jgi:plastocyanin